ncbi:MAG: 2-oxoacid:acceptor oxidoreductase family protein [Candidatus Omnitrophota bacterium]|jgi:2-oxoglutarate ferredoxin oxidoreductase subunit gamma
MDKRGNGKRVSPGKDKVTRRGVSEKIIIAGAGGQGIMLLGKVLAEAAMREGKNVTWIPSYGAEVRGGTAHCMVVISGSEIGSPYIYKADALIIMNEPSLEKFKGRVRKGGLLIVNSSLVSAIKGIDKSVGLVKYPFSGLAERLGNIKVANMVALGAFISHKRTVDARSVAKVMRDIAPSSKKHLVKINQEALSEGIRLK